MRRHPARAIAFLLVVLASVAPDGHLALAANYHKADDSCGYDSSDPNYVYSPYFYADGPAGFWYQHAGDGSGEGCHMWTPTVCGGSSCNVTNWANWYLPVTSNYSGYYDVWVFLVCKSHDGHWKNSSVRYQRFAYGTSGGATETHVVNQNVSTCDLANQIMTALWFDAPAGGKVRMIDKSADYPDPANADYLYWMPA